MKRLIIGLLAASFIVNYTTPLSFENQTDGQLKIRIEYTSSDRCAPEEFLVEKDKQHIHAFDCFSGIRKITIKGTSGKAAHKATLELLNLSSPDLVISNKNDGSLIATSSGIFQRQS